MTPAEFLQWLVDWRGFVGCKRLGGVEPGPLLVCIDGLDESRPPEEGDWPLQLLPPAAAVPDGIYLLLTSRPVDNQTAPAFLRDRIAPLYSH